MSQRRKQWHRAAVGPFLSHGFTTVYTCPAGKTARIRYVNVQNSGDDTVVWAVSLRQVAWTTGCDFMADSSPARQVRALIGHWCLAAGEILFVNFTAGSYLSVWCALEVSDA